VLVYWGWELKVSGCRESWKYQGVVKAESIRVSWKLKVSGCLCFRTEHEGKQTRISTTPNTNNINTVASLRMALYLIQFITLRKLTDNGRINSDARLTALFNGSWHRQGKQNLFVTGAILYNEIKNPRKTRNSWKKLHLVFRWGIHVVFSVMNLTFKKCVSYI